jgi:hypothetical protein
MNIELLGRQAIDIIKSKWTLPETGFLAGGSIANIVWELVSGNKAVVNDIDIFIFDGIVDLIDPYDKDLLFRYQEKESKYYEDYTGMCFHSVNKDFYTIVDSINDGLINTIRYKSNKKDVDLILRSFDINATKIGYSIDEDKIYYQSDFVDFIKTGELKVCNLMTPSHTAIRIVKKKEELNCKLDIFETNLIRSSLNRGFSDVIKIRFKERYHDLYNKYFDKLKDFFTIERDNYIESYIKEYYKEDTKLYFLKPIEFDFGLSVLDDINISQIRSSKDFIFYMRNICGDNNLSNFWSKLNFFFNDIDYIDCEVSPEDLELLSRLGKYAPNVISNLVGLKLSEQIKIVKDIFSRFEDDPIIAISILEKQNLKGVEFSDENLLLLELSVRRQIVSDNRGKSNRILDIKEEQRSINLNSETFDV